MTDSIDTDSLKRDPAVLRSYLSRHPFKRVGKEYESRCKFHEESTPSMKLFLGRDGAWMWTCFGACNESGDVISFVEKSDGVSFREAVDILKKELGQDQGKDWADVSAKSKSFVGVVPDKPYVSFSLEQYSKLESAFEGSSADVWCNNRGILAPTAKTLKFGFLQSIRKPCPKFAETYPDEADAGWLAVPYIKENRVELIKYRSVSTTKRVARQPGMKTCLLGIDNIDSFEPVFVVAGEMDLAVFVQAGFSVVALPADGYTVSPEERDRLKQADCIYLAGDMDESGSKCMAKLLSELGENTWLLKWPDSKDGNEAYLKAGSVEKFRELIDQMISTAKSCPMEGVYDLQQAMLSRKEGNLVDHPDRMRFPWQQVDQMAILLPGSLLSVFATTTKLGKSAFVLDFTIHGARKHNEVVLNYQCELSVDELSNVVAAHLLQKDRNHLDKEDYKLASKLLGDAKYYVGRDTSLTTVGPVLDLIEAGIRRLGATVVVLDHIHFIIRNEKNQVEAEANAMQRLKNMAVKYKVKMVVVGQPRKASKQDRGKRPSKADWKGSEAGTSDSDFIICLHRDEVHNFDPNNPPRDHHEAKTEIHALGGRALGDGAAYAELMFIGKYASFVSLSKEPEVLDSSAGTNELF